MSTKFQPGMVYHEEVVLSPELVEAFADFSGDRNPLHLVPDAALAYGYAHPVAHGAIQSAIVSRIIGMKVPGAGAVWMSQSMEWLRPAFVGETIRVEVEIEALSSGAEVISLRLRASNAKGEKLMEGLAKVKIAATIAGRPEVAAEKEVRVALVTGGSRGIGAAAARSLARAGSHVVIAYHSDEARARALVQELGCFGCEASCFATDLMQEQSGSTLVRRVLEEYGRLDIIVHAATQALPGNTLLETTHEELSRCLHMQVRASLELAQAAAPGMAERGFGRMVFLGTSYLFGPPPAKLGAYVTAKQALWGLVRCLAVELGPKQITVNLVSPGMTVTDLTSDIPQRLKEVEARKVPLRRLAVPDDTAGIVAFLAGDEAGYINGQNLPLTGGPV
jgi:3-oxoacyl-[acyl-carrier protein] reductase